MLCMIFFHHKLPDINEEREKGERKGIKIKTSNANWFMRKTQKFDDENIDDDENFPSN